MSQIHQGYIKWDMFPMYWPLMTFDLQHKPSGIIRATPFIHTLCMRSFTVSPFEIFPYLALSKLFSFWLPLSPNDLWPQKKKQKTEVQPSTENGRDVVLNMGHLHGTYQVWYPSRLPKLLEIYYIYKDYTFRHLTTLTELWSPLRTIGIIYSIHLSHAWDIMFTSTFHYLTSIEPKWPFDFNKYNTDIKLILDISMPSMNSIAVTVLEICF